MKRIYFVTEGYTDQIIIQGLIEQWLGDEDFTVSHIQPPSSAYAEGLDSNLSEGWKGVLAWCSGQRMGGKAGRDEIQTGGLPHHPHGCRCSNRSQFQITGVQWTLSPGQKCL
jgi:hypothetical protein